MEEILASIRRIISEDEPAAEEPVAEEAPVVAEAASPPVFEEEDPIEDDVLELTHVVDDEPSALEAESEIDVLEFSPQEPPADPEIVAPAAASPVFEAPPVAPDEPLVGVPAAASAASAFDMLERTVMMPAAGRTLEDVVRELLRPMMKAWLDENLPSIVEAQVAAEVERIARLRR